jgi:hypothetical protein
MFLRKFGVWLQVESVLLPGIDEYAITCPATNCCALRYQGNGLRDLPSCGGAAVKGSTDVCCCTVMTRRLFYDRGFVA